MPPLGAAKLSRSGDIWLVHSRRYANPESYLIPRAQWRRRKEEICRQIQASPDGATRLQGKTAAVTESLRQLDQLLVSKQGSVRIENGRLVLSPLTVQVLPDLVS